MTLSFFSVVRVHFHTEHTEHTDIPDLFFKPDVIETGTVGLLIEDQATFWDCIMLKKKGTSCFLKKHVKQVQKAHDLAVPLGTVLRL